MDDHSGATAEREAGISRTRRVTVATALFAAGLAGGGAAVAAATLPGRSAAGDSTSQRQQQDQSATQGDQGGSAQQPGTDDGGFRGPAQAPGNGSDQVPAVQSGGS